MKKITKISKQVRRKHRYSIYLDNEFAFGVDEDVLIKYDLKKGLKLENSFIEDVLKAEEQSKANNYSLNLLSYRARSEREIRDKMREKGYDPDQISNTIDFLNKYEYLNDFEFGLSLARDRQKLKKAGEQLIRQELYIKGISKENINKILEIVIERDEEYERALELAKKKADTTYRNDDSTAKYRKLSSFLMRKGYPYEIVAKIMKEVM